MTALLAAGCERDVPDSFGHPPESFGHPPPTATATAVGQPPLTPSTSGPRAASTVACDAPPVRADRPRTGPLPSKAGRPSESLAAKPFPRGATPVTFEALVEEVEVYAASAHPLARVQTVHIDRVRPDGTIAVADGVSATLTWSRPVAGARPGEDVDAGFVNVRADGPGPGGAVPSWSGRVVRAASWGRMANRNFVDSELAHCTLAKAWKVAVASGLPADSVASVTLKGDAVPATYRFDVAGHPEHARWIEVPCCRVHSIGGRRVP